MAKKRVKKKIISRPSSVKRVSKGEISDLLLIIIFLLNIILPGLGSIIGKRIKVGIYQIILTLIGALFYNYYNNSAVIVGVGIYIVALIWGLITGIELVNERH